MNGQITVQDCEEATLKTIKEATLTTIKETPSQLFERNTSLQRQERMPERVLRRQPLVRIEHEALLQKVREGPNSVLVLGGAGSLHENRFETLLGLCVGDELDDGFLRHRVLHITAYSISDQRLKTELEVLGEHGLLVQIQVGLDVSLDHLVGHVTLQVLDHTKHVVVAHAGEGHVACEQLA